MFICLVYTFNWKKVVEFIEYMQDINPNDPMKHALISFETFWEKDIHFSFELEMTVLWFLSYPICTAIK